jgi:AcrR family transcriptional regulator
MIGVSLVVLMMILLVVVHDEAIVAGVFLGYRVYSIMSQLSNNVKEVDAWMPIGRREWAKQDKRERIRAGARELFAEHGVGDVTTPLVADRADVAIDTLYLYAPAKAELLIMVQNQRLAAAIDAGLAAAAVTARLQRHPHAKVVTCARSRPTGARGCRRAGNARSRATCVG